MRAFRSSAFRTSAFRDQVFRRFGIDLDDEAGVAREEARVRREFWPKLRRLAAGLPFAEDLVAAYFCAFDRNTPRRVQVALIGALAYFVLPFDFIPDMMPLIGFADDAAVLTTVVRLVAAHIGPHHREAARRVLARTLTPSERDAPEFDEPGLGASVR